MAETEPGAESVPEPEPDLAPERPAGRDERDLLRDVLLDGDLVADVARIIDPADFADALLGLVFLAVLEVAGEDGEVGAVEVGRKLADLGDLERVGGQDALDAMATGSPDRSGALARARRIRGAAVRRRLAAAAAAIEEAVASEAPAEEIAGVAERAVFTAVGPRQDEEVPQLADFMEQTLDDIEAVGHGTARYQHLTGIPTGFADLDLITGGLQAGNLIVIGSRPGIGSSTLALDILRSCTVEQDVPAVLFAGQMTKQEVSRRVLSATAAVPLHHLRSGMMSDDDWTRLARRMPKIVKAPLYVDDTATTLVDIRSRARRLVARRGVKLIVVDPVQLLNYGLRPFASRYEEVNEISRHLKLMAKELGVPVLAVSKLNRGPAQRPDRRPQPVDLRDSGTLEDDADLLLLLHREDAYEKESPNAGIGEIAVAKQVHGPTGLLEVAFQPHYSRFMDLLPSRE
ncbi:replicative DNA helicase [Kitasatospora sp. NPDC088134]|uniref:replicative DNA helicase n=1 Tax=Kitasatospora sp. NPDC088134 TaxID=3364071 RepID=UPI0038073500